ncbi:HAD family hydrolase [Faecalimicrobium sp. JNUCC 81]
MYPYIFFQYNVSRKYLKSNFDIEDIETYKVEMLSTVECSIDMGNTSDEVKGYAKKVTKTVHNDGIAFGIENFIL